MKKHVETVHEEKKPFKCEICDKLCFKHYMKEPVESIHEGSKPFNVKCVTPPVLHKFIWNSMLQGFMAKGNLSNVKYVTTPLHESVTWRNMLNHFMRKRNNFRNVKFVDTAVLWNLILTGIPKQFMILWNVWSPLDFQIFRRPWTIVGSRLPSHVWSHKRWPR